ncbi:ABC-2 type transport system ATP-binding protein [Enterococcus sp. AZ170]|uniref:ABC transporter ATP-binding protein n=1 Tax=Enterococcus sp. AZ170 TaxID=2774747 RepID=UPI003D2FCF87
MINVRNLSKRFNQTIALENVSFNIKKGEIFGFLGPSGAGKTTTINILTGQLQADSGQASILGNKVNALKGDSLENIGIVSDKSGYYEKLSLYKNLLLYGKIFKQDKNRIETLIKQVGLFESKDKPVEKLSTGMRQRMLLARALINQPKILFLDEPTSGLDPSTSKTIHELLLKLKQAGTTIFLTTHDMNEATLLCDNLVLLNNGKLIEQGTPTEIIKKYNTDKKLKVTYVNGENEYVPFSMEKILNKGKEIFSVHSCEPTLEDVFIKLTGVKLNVQ